MDEAAHAFGIMGMDPDGRVVRFEEKLAEGLEEYRKDYAAYYERCKHANSPAMRDPNPRVNGSGLERLEREKDSNPSLAEIGIEPN